MQMRSHVPLLLRTLSLELIQNLHRGRGRPCKPGLCWPPFTAQPLFTLARGGLPPAGSPGLCFPWLDCSFLAFHVLGYLLLITWKFTSQKPYPWRHTELNCSLPFILQRSYFLESMQQGLYFICGGALLVYFLFLSLDWKLHEAR